MSEIDLGDELANYTEEKPQAPGGIYRPYPDDGSTAKLSDLQAQGFNTTPPLGFQQMKDAQDNGRAFLDRILNWPSLKLPPLTIRDGDHDGFEPVGTIHD